jgi:hypothetical protein
MQPLTVDTADQFPEHVLREAKERLIAAGGPASLPAIMWTVGGIELAGVTVQALALVVDLALMVGLSVAMQAALGGVGWWLSGIVWFLPPLMWRLYGRSPGMALFGLYLVRMLQRDAVRPSVIRGFVRLWLQLLTLTLLPFATVGIDLALFAASWPVLPADRLLRIRVFRYCLLAPAGQSRVERLLDRMAVLSGLRARGEAERQPRDSLGLPD